MKNKIRVGFIYGLWALGFSMVTIPIIDLMVKLNLISEPSDLKFDDLGFVNVFLLLVVIAPMIEEFLFRLIPIIGIRLITKNKLALWIIVIISSVGFGISHGSWHHIFMQGIIGVIFSMAFIKEGYTASVIAHATHNSAIFAILIYLKQI